MRVVSLHVFACVFVQSATAAEHGDDNNSDRDTSFDEQRDWSKTQFKVRRRMFKKSLRSYFILLVKFAGPAFAIVGYLTAVYFWDSAIMHGVREGKYEVYYGQQRRVMVHT